MEFKKRVNKLIRNIDDPVLKRKLMNMMKERNRLMKIKEEQERNQELLNYKYLPEYLMPKILSAVGFIQYTEQKGTLNMQAMVKFLKEKKNFSQKEIGWVLMLLSLDTIEEILSTPEIGSKIQEAIIINRKKTLH
jgi:hypothetical protein